MDKPSASLSSDWIRCQSKSRTNRYYLFNKKTGETNWCSDTDKTLSQRVVLSKNMAKTPAQDRLKRLQNAIQKQKSQLCSPDKVTVKQSKKPKSDNELFLNKKEICTANTSINNPENELSNLGQRKNVGHEKAISKNNIVNIKREQILLTPNLSQKRVANKRKSSQLDGNTNIEPRSAGECSTPASSKAFTNTKVDSVNKDIKKPGIMSMVKAFCDKMLNKSTKPKKRKLQEKQEKLTNLSVNSKPCFKTKIADITSAARGVLQANDNAKRLPSVQQNAPITRAGSLQIPVPSCRGANVRLQRLRNSLQAQQKSLSLPSPSASDSLSKDSNSIGCPNAPTFVSEPMDWQCVSEESSKSYASSCSSPLPKAAATHSSCLSEHYFTVNENLMLLATHNRQKQWKTDHFYFVVDTNVFINTLTFVEDLMMMKLCDTRGSVIYVPYCVLQELDKLKIRSPSESIQLRSARAIKFLNQSFDGKENIQAQSASDETRHLIKVTSPDDSILNCCLQVKEHVDNMLLLTEDNNLQNKAKSSDVMVSTKSDLISKHS